MSQPSFAEVVCQQVVILEAALEKLYPEDQAGEAIEWWRSANRAVAELDLWARKRGERNAYEAARRQQKAMLAGAIPPQQRATGV